MEIQRRKSRPTVLKTRENGHVVSQTIEIKETTYMRIGKAIEDTPELPVQIQKRITLKKGESVGIIFEESSFYYCISLQNPQTEGYISKSFILLDDL